MAHIDEIIKKMGYAESSNLKYGREGFGGAHLSAHNIKVLNELAPYAVYIVDNEPFVLFYEEAVDHGQQKLINRKIWNSQIPVAIICGVGDVKIYSTCDFDRGESALSQVDSIPVKDINENSIFSFWEITSQDFWRKYMPYFNGKKLNDQLLDNLRFLTDKLRNVYHVGFATKLILRLIFIRYLIDRGVNLDYDGFSFNATRSRRSLLDLLTDKNALYALFAHLKGKFNGNLFEIDGEADTSCLTTDVLSLLSDFMSANVNSETGQLSLFDLYDFNIIPVELISNIYEILLGEESRDKHNAFYTPQYIVDYILDGSVSLYLRNHETCKILDPSCGSGIFLVESYRRMVEKTLDGELYSDNDELLQAILYDNIYGVDLIEDAVDVAIFSLYLAVLDYKNPKTLEEFKLPNLKGKKIFVNDFFDEDALMPLQEEPFDFIVGNPPWGKGFSLQQAYIEKHNYECYMQNHDTCRAFVLRSKDFCSVATQCCFVLHSKLLYMQKGTSKNFREFLLTNTRISRIVELSSVRKLVFKHADAPAVVLSYSFSKSAQLEHQFEYISMKPNIFFRLFNIIVVEKTDVKFVQQKLLYDYDWAWKTLVYGLSGDVETIIHLGTFDKLSTLIEKSSPQLQCGVGIEDHPGDQKDASHLIGRILLKSESIDHFSINISNSEIFAKPRIHRPKSGTRLFEAPYCLLKKGIDTTTYTMKSVFIENDYIYRATAYCIKGDKSQTAILLTLTGLFNSTLYAYMNLMTGSSLGVEREQRFMDEVLNFPVILDTKIADQVKQIQDMITTQESMVSQSPEAEIAKLNEFILKAFHLENNAFVDYALRVQIPQLTKSDFAFHTVKEHELTDYARLFVDKMTNILAPSGKYVIANVYPAITKYYSAVEIVLQDKQPDISIYVKEDSVSVISALTRFSVHRINDEFYVLKDVIHFEENSFYIIKPNFYKNWHLAIGQLDLAEVIDQILSRNGGNN